MLTTATLRNHWALLAFGWLMTFGSAFGQTYFISIFGGLIRSEFGLSHAAFGGLYSAGTLASASVLIWAGRLIDSGPLLSFSTGAIVGLALSAAVMAFTQSLFGLLFVFFALRFFGQGLMTHAAMTAIARNFSAERGRAVSFAALGHVSAEAVLPLAAVALMAIIHWRNVWLASSLALVMVLLPIVAFLLKRAGQELQLPAAGTKPEDRPAPRQGAAMSAVLRDSLLYCLLPTLLAPAFISTGLVFHQIHIADQKGWSLEVLAFGLTAFAAGSFLMMLAAGVLVDRLSSRRLMPFSLSPSILACFVLAWSSSAISAFLFFAMLGVQSGLMSVIHGAVWAEIYGTRHLGAIRAFATSSMVFASGLAPVFVGILIGGQWSVANIALTLAGYALAASALAWIGLNRAFAG